MKRHVSLKVLHTNRQKPEGKIAHHSPKGPRFQDWGDCPCLKCLSHTYREWDTLDAADGEAVVAGIAGAAEHLVAVHGADYCPFDATAKFVLVSICEIMDITTVFSNLLNGQLRNTHSQRYRSDWPRTTTTPSGCCQRHLLVV